MTHVGVAQWLDSITGLTYSETGVSNIFIDHIPDSPDQAVAVYSNAGPESDSKLPYDEIHFQIIVRSNSDEQWALDKWKAIYSRLHGARNIELPDGTLLIYALAMQSSPFPLGDDVNGRPQYSGDYRAEILNPTEARPE